VSTVLSARTVACATLPVIDVSGLRSRDPAARAAVGKALRAACADKGFFYIEQHGVDGSVIDAARRESQAFFALPEAEKLAVDKALSFCNRGYEPLRGQVLEAGAPPDLKEGFYIGNELSIHHPRVIRRAFNSGPNQWPARPDGFRTAMEAYFAALFDLSVALTRGLALSLDLPETYFDTFCHDAMATLRLLHYPPQPRNALPDQKGCGAHTDFGCLTLLWQDDNGGLQVQEQDGSWIHVPPLPETFVVNLGDLIARWTNDRYRSTMHRVVNHSGCERYSIPFFFTGNADYVVKCLPGCSDEEHPVRYRPTMVAAHLEACYRRTYR
jgi:isopenicillin N synthase-like dioxygenase